MKDNNSNRTDLQKWLIENKHNLSIRFNTAKVNLTQINNRSERKITLGKYNSSPQYAQYFYKPISKIISELTLDAE